MVLKKDRVQTWLDGSEFATFQSIDDASHSAGAIFNASNQDYDFTIKGDDTTPIFQVYGESGGNRIRIRDHLTIGKNEAVSHAQMVDWGLAVTGSSLFYSGGSSLTNINAISAVGDISGTTNLYIDDNIYSGTTNLLDIFATSLYWSANTDGSITPSGLTTTLQTEGDLTVSGTIRTTTMTTTGGTSADTLTIQAGTVNIRNQDGLTEYLKIAPDGFSFLLNDTVAINFNDGNQYYYFDGRPGSGTDWYTFNFHGDKGYDVMLLDPEWEVSRFRKHVAISDTYALWPNAMAIQYGLYVSGSSRFLSGGTYVSTNAIEAVGDISGTTNLYLDGESLIKGNLGVTGGTYSNILSAQTQHIADTLGVSGMTTLGSVGISGQYIKYLNTSNRIFLSSDPATTPSKLYEDWILPDGDHLYFWNRRRPRYIP